jgi:PTH1 family peptidyl-tRNA hydrolase
VAEITPIQLVVGLGNPGEKYTKTRHNAGFWFLDQLAYRHQASFRQDSKFKGGVASFDYQGNKIWLLKPSTFMNLSGESLAPLAKYYQIDPKHTLVVHDELDLPPGTSRFKLGGGHGGHNGLRDIFKHYAKDFWRLRVGVGHPGHKDQVLSFVLNSASKQEQQLIDQSLDIAIEAMQDAYAGDMEAAMRLLHNKQ